MSINILRAYDTKEIGQHVTGVSFSDPSTTYQVNGDIMRTVGFTPFDDILDNAMITSPSGTPTIIYHLRYVTSIQQVMLKAL